MCDIGEWTSEEVVTPDITNICLEVKSDIEAKVGTTFENFIPLSFRTQIVKGTSFVVKVYVGVDKCLHAKLFHDLPCDGGKLTVNGVQHPKTASEPLIPFDH